MAGPRGRRGPGGRGDAPRRSVFDSLFSNFWIVLLLKTVAVVAFFPSCRWGSATSSTRVAHMQAQLRPMEAGRFHGWAQLVADGVKFVQKEDIIPAADRNVFSLAPAVAMIPYIAILVVLPSSDSWFAENLDIGIFYVLAISSISVIGVMMAGWSSANKFSLIGALRAAAQLIAYDPAGDRGGDRDAGGDAVAGRDRRGAAGPVVRRPAAPGFVIFMMAAFAELQRPPFDMPIADSEIIFGAYTEYTGLKFAFFLLAEYGGSWRSRGSPRCCTWAGTSRSRASRSRAADDDGQDRALAFFFIWLPRHCPSTPRGPAAAVLLARVDPAVPGPDGRRGGEGGVLDGRAVAAARDGVGLAKGLSVTLKTMLRRR